MAKILITGGTGCIGASTVHKLLDGFADSSDQIVLASRNNQTESMRLWLGERLDDLIREKTVSFEHLDLQDLDQIAARVEALSPTHIIHLGALQSPDCASNPQRGLQINLAGTLGLFEAAASLGKKLERFVFASSAAVYGKRAMYPGDTVTENVVLAPPNLYGVWKVAGEHLAALFHQQTETPTVCLRLNTTFGPGRDRGLTSAPTRIMKSLAAGAVQGKSIRCEMPYAGRENYHYVEDVGAHFAGSCMLPFQGVCSLNIKGKTIPVDDFLRLIGSVATEMGIESFFDSGISEQATSNLFVCDLDDSQVDKVFPGLPRTELRAGIRKTVQQFMELAKVGELDLV